MVMIVIQLQTWTQAIINRGIGKIIARDRSLVESHIYRMAVIRPHSLIAVALSISVRADLLGSIPIRRERERKGMKAVFIPAGYVLVHYHKFS